jgi:hypothetical protein
MNGWSDFTVVTGGASAALVGLLFVAVTLRIDAIARAPDLRSRAAQTLTLFAVALTVAIVLTVPAQPDWALGAELVAVALLGGTVMLVLNSRAERVSHTDPIASLLDRFGPNATTIVLIGAAGILVATRVDWGIYLLVPAELAALIGGVLSAWLFLTKAPDVAEDPT